MLQKNGRLVVIVASVAVAAVVIGGAIAYGQGPRSRGGAAAPLPAPATTPAPSTPSAKTPTPSTTPPATPTATPSKTPDKPTGPVKITLDLAKLPRGRDPQLPYLVGRVVRGGAGGAVTVPGKAQIHQIARVNGVVLAVVVKGLGTELLKLGPGDGDVHRTPDVSAVVTGDDGALAAYSTTRIGSQGEELKGGTLYSDNGGFEQHKLDLPSAWGLRVLAVVNGTVYYEAGSKEGSPSELRSWKPGAANGVPLKISRPTGISADGKLVASMGLVSDGGSCSDITEIATGRRLWKTCESSVEGFTPDSRTAFGGPAYADGYCSRTASALDGLTGVILREWTSCFFDTVPEDDQHLLIVADAENGGGEDESGQRAILRCTVGTGACELATPLTKTGVQIGS
ncbi:hypothetical protein OHA70_15145 [Kribbella sp. NBC_00382]|uniref:hypothetical protein n=1 Tax=Kribbella sp. NBC_00382 TaxID=2975967 RepID=UPI002E2012F1